MQQLRDERGSVMVEYVVVLSLVTVVCAGAMATLGVLLVREFHLQATWLAIGFP